MSPGGLFSFAFGFTALVVVGALREELPHAASVTQGANPSVQRKSKRAAASVLEVVGAYLRHASTRQRPRSYKETERHLRQHAAPLHHERAEGVGRRDIATLLERVAKTSGPVAANRTRAALSAMWGWGLRTGLIEDELSAKTIHNAATLLRTMLAGSTSASAQRRGWIGPDPTLGLELPPKVLSLANEVIQAKAPRGNDSPIPFRRPLFA